MSKIRVHELAKELNKSSKDVIYALKGHGVVVESHMSTIGEDSADKIRKFFTAPPVKKQDAQKAPGQDRLAARNNGNAGQGERRPYNNNGQNRQGGQGERRPYNNNGQNRQGGQGERRP